MLLHINSLPVFGAVPEGGTGMTSLHRRLENFRALNLEKKKKRKSYFVTVILFFDRTIVRKFDATSGAELNKRHT